MRALEQENAQRAAVQEALGRLREITGVRAYSGGGRGVRFYRPDEMETIAGVRIVGVLR
jgi:plasmid stabilization system protein ParE